MGQWESRVGPCARARTQLNIDNVRGAELGVERGRRQASRLRWIKACATLLVGTACSSLSSSDGSSPQSDDLQSDELAGNAVGSEAFEIEAVDELGAALPGDPLVPAPGAARLLTKKQYLRTVGMLLGPAARTAAEPLAWLGPTGESFAAAAAVRRTVPSAGAVVAIGKAADAAARAAVNDRTNTSLPLAAIDTCTTQAITEANQRKQCYQRVAVGLGRIAFRVPLLPEQVDTLVAIAQQAEANPEPGQTAFDSGLQQLLSAILQGPGLMYSVEVGDTSVATPRPLLPHELATRLSLGLVGQAPSLELLEEAAIGGLDTAAEIKAVAQSLLDTPEAQEAFWDTFAEWFLIDNFDSVTRPSFSNFDPALRADIVEEAKRFAIDHVFGPSPLPFPQIYSSQRRSITALLASNIYTESAIPVNATGWTDINFNSYHNQRRAGVLTLPAFLTMLASDKQTKIIARGKFTWEHVLCGTVIEFPPGGVGAVPIPPEPPDNVTTWRKLFEDHAAPACAGCHMFFDAGGFSHEHFDQIGAYRERDFGGGNGVINAQTTVVHPTSTFTRDILDGLDYGKLMADPLFPDSDKFIENTAHCQMTQLHESLVGERMQEDVDGTGMHLTATAEFDAIVANLPGYPQFMLQDFLAELVASPYFTEVGPGRL